MLIKVNSEFYVSFFDYSHIKKKIAPMGWNWLYFSDNYSTEALGRWTR